MLNKISYNYWKLKLKRTLIETVSSLWLAWGFSSCDDEPQPQPVDPYEEIASRFDCPVDRDFVEEWRELYTGMGPHRIENDLVLSGRDGNNVVIPVGSYLFRTDADSVSRAFDLINYSDIENGNIGRCRPADILCLSDEISGNGYWEMAWAGIGPSPEMCDEHDWDCDGNPNNGFEIYREFECLPEMDLGTFNPDTLVYNNGEDGNKLSICAMGTRHCTGVGWSECAEAVGPENSETCNGLDDTCNGIVDEIPADGWGSCPEGEGFPDGVGICSLGEYQCIDRELICIGAVYPIPETCNGLDDDCNGVVDNDIPPGWCYDGSAATLDVGECHAGQLICQDGSKICIGQVTPTDEICDGIDNDCDEEIDEELSPEELADCDCNPGDSIFCKNPEVLYEGELIVLDCAYGIMICDGNGQWSSCRGVPDPEAPESPIPRPETCNNYDDDCDSDRNFDGELDDPSFDGIDVDPETGEPLSRECYPEELEDLIGIGICQSGTSVCDFELYGGYSPCTNAVLPLPYDICLNGVDDNCDGEDNVYEIPRVDILFEIDTSGSMKEELAAVINICINARDMVSGTDARVGVARFGHNDRTNENVEVPVEYHLPDGSTSTYDHRLGAGYTEVLVSPTDITNTINVLSRMLVEEDTMGSTEPSLDALYLSTHPNPDIREDAFGLMLRPDALHVYILFTDEVPQTNLFNGNLTQASSEVLSNINYCMSLPEDAGKCEVYAYVEEGSLTWQLSLPNDRQRVFDLSELIESGTLDPGISISSVFNCSQGCLSDSDCTGYQQCIDNICRAPPCDENRDCPSGTTCSTAAGICVDLDGE